MQLELILHNKDAITRADRRNCEKVAIIVVVFFTNLLMSLRYQSKK